VSNDWDVLQDIVADPWDLAQEEESENACSTTEASKGETAMLWSVSVLLSVSVRLSISSPHFAHMLFG